MPPPLLSTTFDPTRTAIQAYVLRQESHQTDLESRQVCHRDRDELNNQREFQLSTNPRIACTVEVLRL